MDEAFLDLRGAKLDHAQALEQTAQQLLMQCTVEGGRAYLTIPEGTLAPDKYLVFDVEMRAKQAVCLVLDFWDAATPPEDESNLWVKIGVLDNLRTRVAFPLEYLDSRSMFLPPTPGQLKMVVFGKPLDPARVNRFSIGTVRTQMPYDLEIRNVHIADQMPAFPLPEGDIRVDAIGQYIPKPWPGICAGEPEMVAYLRALRDTAQSEPLAYADPNWDACGGDTRIQFDATGFFRTEKRDGRWWLVTPEGHGFFSNGVDCVAFAASRVAGLRPFFSWLPDRDDARFAPCWTTQSPMFGGDEMFDFLKANLIRAFGEDWFSAWTQITRHRLMRWGFNTIGNWSDEAFIRDAQMPYVWPMRDFPGTERFIFRDFPDVLSPEYEANSQRFAQQLLNSVDDPYMIGYFMRNEPIWAFVEGLCIAETLLANPASFVSKDRLIASLQAQYGSIGALNEAWHTQLASFEDLRSPIHNAASLSDAAKTDLEAFSNILYRAYNTIPAIACKAVDAHHLNLGMRYGYISQPGLVEGWEHLDVFSINSYYVSPVEQVEQAAALMDIPVMVGEYHFGSLDSGMVATGLRAVPTQADRATAYRYFIEQGASHPHFVGAHYFTLYDQPVIGRFDGENYQIGLLDVTHKPYEAFVAPLAECHSATYDIAAGRSKPWEETAPEVPKVAY